PFGVNRAGKDVLDDWLTQLADARAQAKIATRINRVAAGNFGDCKSLRQGIYELRVDWGPGYRVYYAMIGRECVLLLWRWQKKTDGRTSGGSPPPSTAFSRDAFNHPLCDLLFFFLVG